MSGCRETWLGRAAAEERGSRAGVPAHAQDLLCLFGGGDLPLIAELGETQAIDEERARTFNGRPAGLAVRQEQFEMRRRDKRG